MAISGNFLEIASSTLGNDVGYGKMILVYAEKSDIAAADLTATAINAAIEAGTIIGVIKNWHTVAGASVAETNVERPGSGEMKVIRPEILADTLTFEGNILNRRVCGELVKNGTLPCLLVDDLGNSFGEESNIANKISTMYINFTGKTSSGLQRDNSSDKSVAVTARYLVKEIAMLNTSIETEDVAYKTEITLRYVSTSSQTSGSAMVIRYSPITKGTQEVADVTGETFSGDFSSPVALTLTSAAVTSTYIDVTLGGTGVPASGLPQFTLSLTSDAFFMKSTKFN